MSNTSNCDTVSYLVTNPAASCDLKSVSFCKATTDEDHKVRVCAEHLQRYNDGLNLSNTIRMRDAFSFLNQSHEEERKKKTQEAEQKIDITPTERFLLKLFEGITVWRMSMCPLAVLSATATSIVAVVY